MKYRVWHIPQIPMKPFIVEVSGPQEGKKIGEILADYDLFQYKNKIKPDYSNMNGLEVLENGEWLEWEDEDGNNIFDHDVILPD